MTDTGVPDIEALARDWIALWQSELSAMAEDREAPEAFQATLALWANLASVVLKAALESVVLKAAPRDSAPRAEAAAAASDARDVEIDRLARHVTELEARLAELERGRGAGGAGKRKR